MGTIVKTSLKLVLLSKKAMLSLAWAAQVGQLAHTFTLKSSEMAAP
jgi:hypothetical protein